MDVTYTVHSAVQQDFQTEVLLNGKSVPASIPGLVVELVSTDGAMTHTLKVIPDDMAQALLDFAPGNSITGTFTKVV